MPTGGRTGSTPSGSTSCAGPAPAAGPTAAPTTGCGHSILADDLATPNEAYFARCDRMIELAGRDGLLVILDPCETIDHVTMMVHNGPEKCRAFGRYLGEHYRHFDNLLWMSGNDFNTWKRPDHDAAVRAVAMGIRDADARHLQTIELEPRLSGSLDDPSWAPIIGLCASYTYYPTYAQVLKDYNRPDAPAGVHGGGGLRIRARQHARRPAAAGVLGRPERRDGPALRQRVHLAVQARLEGETGYARRGPDGLREALFEPRAWYDLVPDQKHTVVVAGYGTFDGTATEGNCFVMTSDYVTAGRTPDGSLVMAYLPSRRTVTVDMSKLSGPATARWYDPSRGTYLAAEECAAGQRGQARVHAAREQRRRGWRLGVGAGDIAAAAAAAGRAAAVARAASAPGAAPRRACPRANALVAAPACISRRPRPETPRTPRSAPRSAQPLDPKDDFEMSPPRLAAARRRSPHENGW